MSSRQFPAAGLLTGIMRGRSRDVTASALRGLCMALAVHLVLCTAFVAGACAQSSSSEAAVGIEDIARWQGAIETMEKALGRIESGDAPLPNVRGEMRPIINAARARASEAQPLVHELETQLARLGEAPASDALPEAQTIADERRRLNNELTRLRGIVSGAELIEERARALIARAESIRRQRFTGALLRRTVSPLLPDLWSRLYSDATDSWRRISTLASSWWARAAPHGRIGSLAVVALAVWLLLRLLGSIVLRARRAADLRNQDFIYKAVANVRVALVRALPWYAAFAILYLGLAYLDLLPPTVEPVVFGALSSAALLVTVWALAKSLLAPRSRQWRLLETGDIGAPRLVWLISAVAAVYALDRFLNAVSIAIQAPIALTVAQSFIFSMLFVALFALLLRTPWRAVGDQEAGPWFIWPAWLKLPLWVVVICIAGASLLGYVAFGRFLAGQLVLTGTIAITALLIHLALREFTSDIQSDRGSAARFLATHFGATTVQRTAFALIASIALNLALLTLAVALTLLQFGFSTDTIRSWLHSAFFGFDIGSVRLSLSQILIAAALFAGVILVTRMLQRWLADRILLPPRVDTGLANSIQTGISYGGFAFAALTAISYAGLDFTNLAIVAGALSVGIGFGLQTIVNNFISGIILLVERPVQVGDWVIAGDAEGYIRRISVRSTEIETFDRASVIVPNSELISGRVTNWTHRNKLGRVVIPVGVSYESDPRAVQDLLIEIGRNHPLALAWPAPFVVFENFGASSLDFSLRVYIADVNDSISVSTDLRMTIVEAFRKADIEIPYPQQDIHLRDLDPVKSALARAREEAAAREARETNPAPKSPPVRSDA